MLRGMEKVDRERVTSMTRGSDKLGYRAGVTVTGCNCLVNDSRG